LRTPFFSGDMDSRLSSFFCFVDLRGDDDDDDDDWLFFNWEENVLVINEGNPGPLSFGCGRDSAVLDASMPALAAWTDE